MNYSKIFLLLSFFLLLISVGAISASDVTDNITDEVTTPILDNTNIITNDVEQIQSTESVDTESSDVSIVKEDKNENINEINKLSSTYEVTVENYGELYTTITNLNTEDDSATITLSGDDVYTITNQIVIDTQTVKDITIDGQGRTIDGQDTQNFIQIAEGYTLTLKNINIKNTAHVYNSTINGSGIVKLDHIIISSNFENISKIISDDCDAYISNSIWKVHNKIQFHWALEYIKTFKVDSINTIFLDDGFTSSDDEHVYNDEWGTLNTQIPRTLNIEGNNQTFDHNPSFGDYSDAWLEVLNGYNVNINNISIANADDFGMGGVLSVQQNCYVTLNNSKIVHASTYQGGAIYIYQGTMIVSNTSFINCSGSRTHPRTSSYGGVFRNDYGTLIVSNSSFIDSAHDNNYTYGGVLYNYYGVSKFDDCTFNNTTALYGGVFYSSNGQVQVSNSNISTVIAKSASSSTDSLIYSSASTFNITNVTIDGCSGGYAPVYARSSTINVNNSTISNCNGMYAGFIALFSGSVNSTNNNISSNTATYASVFFISSGNVNITSTNMSENSGSYGVIYNTASVNITDSIIYNNTQGDLLMYNGGVISVNNTLITNNTPVEALIQNNGNMTYNNTNVTDNVAGSFGIFYTAFESIDILENCVLDNNEAGYLVLSYQSDFNLTNVTVSNNNATALIYNQVGNMSILNSNLTNNSGTVSVIHNTEGILEFDNNKFFDNYVTGDDSYVIVDNGTTTITNNLFNNNTDNYRDMLLTSFGTLTINNNDYLDNYLEDSLITNENTLYSLNVDSYFITDNKLNGMVTVTIGENLTVYEIVDGATTIKVPMKLLEGEYSFDLTFDLVENAEDLTDANVTTTYNDTVLSVNKIVDNASDVRVNIVTLDSDDEFNITLSLREVYNDMVRNGTIDLIYADETLAQFEVKDSQANVTIPTNFKSGVNIINLGYRNLEGYKHYQPTTFAVLLELEKIPTNTTITTDGDKEITVKLNDSEGNALAQQNITFFINDDEAFNKTTNEDGLIVFTYEDFIIGDNTIMAVFNGTTIYDPSNDTYILVKSRQNITVLIEDIEDVVLGDSVTITGVITGEDGTPVANSPIKIKINEEVFDTTTNEDGVYTYPYTTSVEGLNNVTVTCPETETTYENENFTSFNAVKLDTSITLDLDSYSKVGRNNTITGVLTYDDGEVLPNTDITIIINDIPYYTTTNQEGVYEYNYTPQNEGMYKVVVSYGGGTRYNPCNTSKTFFAEKTDTILTSDLLNSIKVEENNTIRGTLLDIDGNPLDGVNVTITVNGNDTNVSVVGGNYEFKYNATAAGVYNVNISFAGNDEYYPSNSTRAFNVEKVDTIIDVEAQSPIKVNNETIITGTLIDEFGDAIGDMPVTIVVNDEEPVVVETNDDGIFTYPYIASIVGLNNVTVNYTGNNKYNSSNSSASFMVEIINAEITLNVDDAKIDNITTISGILTDEFNQPITGAEIIIKINDNEEIAVKTGQDGKYTYDYLTDTVGENNVTVIFDGKGVYEDLEANKTFTVSKIATNITVNSAKIHIGEQTRVVGKLIDEFDNPLAYTTIIVKVNGEDYTTVMTNTTGKFAVYYTPSAVGLIDIELLFEETGVYLASNATTNISSGLMPTKLTVEATDCAVGDVSYINGRLTDYKDNPISDKEVYLAINNKIVQKTTTLEDGSYFFEYTTRLAVTQNVTIRFSANDTYRNCSTNTTFEVSALKSKMILTVDDVHVGENTTISGLIYDVKGNTLSNLLLTLNINDQYVTHIRSNEDGEFNYSYKTSITGINNVSISYPGTTNYDASSIDKSFNVLKNATNMTIDVRNSTVGSISKITGQLTDVNCNPVKNVEVKIVVNDEIVGVATTNSNGKFLYNYTSVLTGQNNLTVVFEENENFTSTESSATFNVRKLKTNITINAAKTHINETAKLSGKLTDINGEVISNATILVQVDGVDVESVTTDENGKYVIYYTPDKVANLTVKVEYAGNDIYLNSSAKSSITSAILPTIITVEATDCVVGESSHINGTVVDSKGNPVASKVVRLAINNVVVDETTTNDDGSYSFDYTTSVAVVQNVTVRFNDNETYRNCSTNTTFNVTPLNTTMILQASDVQIGENTTINGILINNNAEQLNNALITININDAVEKTIRSDENGLFQYSYQTQTSGVNNVTATYTGSTNNVQTSASTTFNVAKNNTIFTYLDARNASVGAISKITGTLLDVNSNKVKSTEVNIVVDDGVVGVATTNSNGKFLFNYTTQSTGTHTIVVDFTGNELYNPTQNSTEIFVRA